MVCSIILVDEGDWIVATDATSGVTSQGKTNTEALANLKEALELYYEDVSQENIETYPTMLTTMEVAI